MTTAEAKDRTDSLSTKRTQALTHERIIVVGEVIRKEYEKEVQHDKNRALLAIEEVVRREEQRICQAKLQEVHNEWLKEKQKLLEQAETLQKIEISNERMKLEKELQKEFEATRLEIQEEHERQLKKELEEAWKEAEEEKEKAMDKAREEERREAEAVAFRVHQQVEEERRQDSLRAREETRRTLREYEEKLEVKSRTERDSLEAELTRQNELKVMKLLEEHQIEETASQQVYYEQVMENKKLRQELHDAIDDGDYWKKNHDNLKQEFSDFIDQFPGFRGEFLLK